MKTYVIEHIDYMDAYRLFDADHPEQTMAYVDTISEAQTSIAHSICKNEKVNFIVAEYSCQVFGEE